MRYGRPSFPRHTSEGNAPIYLPSELASTDAVLTSLEPSEAAARPSSPFNHKNPIPKTETNPSSINGLINLLHILHPLPLPIKLNTTALSFDYFLQFPTLPEQSHHHHPAVSLHPAWLSLYHVSICRHASLPANPYPREIQPQTAPLPQQPNQHFPVAPSHPQLRASPRCQSRFQKQPQELPLPRSLERLPQHWSAH